VVLSHLATAGGSISSSYCRWDYLTSPPKVRLSHLAT